MDNGSILLIVVLLLLVAMSAYFSATETAFTSINRIRVKNSASEGNKRAKLVLDLSQNYDRLLSTILIGNNIVNITSASLATVIFVKYFDDMGVTISTIVMTVLVLIFGEISPKSIAKDAPEQFAMFSAPILRFFIWILTPLNFLFMCWKKLLSKVFKSRPNPTITDEELLTIVEEARQEGGINENEGALLRNAITFNDLDVSDVLTPRVDIQAVEKGAPKELVESLFLQTGFSRLPVYESNMDNIVGVLLCKDFYNNPEQSMESLVKPILYTPYSTKIAALLPVLQKNQNHIAVVTDEYGGTVGIVTLEDLLEELVGEIWDEHDQVEEELTEIAPDTYRVLCTAGLQKTLDFFDVPESDGAASSVSGWVLEQLGRFPKPGDRFTYENLEVTIMKTDLHRVLEITIKRLPVAQLEQAQA